ncbi:hypothetical protein HN419_03820 [Candidatus Woesearchaeota archaeon]|jgi:nicotinamide-nucleotide adenylyltransferase|nr:hypothetical protein [Candidatus Woesearchaeota archaeon]MBT3537995.1 hypothetical protein [Candidatus Woesearchaeota archaeon]MBT4697349.1 hypothetical protein [Candidatus Woesearchaeota archaeon]MBT4717070.1 hypothetical protein [Candidatus Woesearchaeota archaeon]MBT7105664.1 hypothetical protein [Candidatus Woesearchaeota archaeon]
MTELGIVGFIGRFKPLHNGSASALEALCETAEHVVIGIGSSNQYNVRNPFTADESRAMIDLVLGPKYQNYSLVQIPDYAHLPQYRDGSKWKQEVVEQFGEITHFVTGNGYVAELLQDTYEVLTPVQAVPGNRKRDVKATIVRIELATNGDWECMVPEPVADYLKTNGLVERFQEEFAEETLAVLSPDYTPWESTEEERRHVYEGR